MKKKIAPLPFETTCRGFAYGEFKDSNGQLCSLQRSSAFGDEGGELIWLGVTNRKSIFKILPRKSRNDNEGQARFGFGWQEKSLEEMYPGCDISIPDRMHLTQDMVKMLLPALQHFAKTGELPSPVEEHIPS